MSTVTPIIDLATLYVKGCKGAWASNTTRTIEAGQVRDSTNTFDIVVNSQLTVSSAFNGAGGLDTGTVAASTRYYVFVLYDFTQTNAPVLLLSASATAPVLPSANGVAYSAFRLVDTTVTDGSSNFRKDYNSAGNSNVIYKQYDTPVSVLASGNATSYTLVDLTTSGIVPASGFGKVVLNTTYVPNAAGQTASVQPAGATGDFFVDSGIVASVSQNKQVNILPLLSSSKPQVSYKVSVATAPAAFSLAVSGYEFNL